MQTKLDEDDKFENVLRDHDQLVAATGIDLWLGAEPTFADRFSPDPHWQTTALGPGKEAVAREFARFIALQTPGCVVLRTLGRQYPGEEKPRWNIGVYSRRDGTAVWSGPPDPLCICDKPTTESESAGASKVEDVPPGHTLETAVRLRSQLAVGLTESGFAVEVDLPDDAWGVRLLFAKDAQDLREDWGRESAVRRPPIQSQPIPSTGTVDELAVKGIFLVSIGPAQSRFDEDCDAIQVELPDVGDLGLWHLLMDSLCRAARRCDVQSLILTGFPPPVTDEVSWTTVTPDPGVIEVNMAPCPDVSSFYRVQQQLHHAAEQIGLSSFKLLFNGEVVDSGGGQHITFGGSTPDASPFFQRPRLLPSLVAYLNRHPALSYWFAVRSVGSCGQQPRADEVSPESLDGLAVSLDRMFRLGQLSPEAIWGSLNQFLCDRFGNTHRCEVNIEKLWNTYSPARGCLGLVELRAFRMTRTAEDAAAIAVLMRTLIAWLSTLSDEMQLADWGQRLHDRFSLPYYLLRDLGDVLDELQANDFGVDDRIASRLTDDSDIVIGKHDLGSAQITVRQAIEFWPVIGSTSEDEGTFRMMDSSTLRVEVMLELPAIGNGHDPSDWRLQAQGYDIPWVIEKESSRTVLLRGVRYKAFHPQTTVTPLVDVVDPVELTVTHQAERRAWRIRLYNWEPNQLPYDGLPGDLETARHRRSERMLVDRVEALPATNPIRASAISEYCVDLRRV